MPPPTHKKLRLNPAGSTLTIIHSMRQDYLILSKVCEKVCKMYMML